MTLDKACELIEVQVNLGGGYNRNSIRIILAEIKKEHGQEAVDGLIQLFSLDQLFGIQIGEEIHL
ncbi:MAG: hypothetical protein QM479_15235 [Pseudomonadota bacterium]